MSKLQSISLSPLADQRGLKPGTQTFGVDATGKAVAVLKDTINGPQSNSKT
jgi:hypothetical protein